MSFKLPTELKKSLIDKGISFSQWCRQYGFNKALAQRVANKPYKDYSNAPKQKQIQTALKKDFPEVFKKERK